LDSSKGGQLGVGVTDKPRGLRGLMLGSGYVTGRADLLNEFYLPCLGVAARYDRAVGYFRSTLYVVAGLAFSKFAQRGGVTRLVCSPHLTQEDVRAIEKGFSLRERLEASLEAELRAALDYPLNKPIAELLATLIALKVLDIRIAFRPTHAGIFHDKVGVFTDPSGDQVSFLGSPNETFTAWDLQGNHESLEVFCGWTTASDSARVRRHSSYFESLWEGREPGVEVRDFPDALRKELLKLADPNGIDPAAERVRQVVSSRADVRTATRARLQDHQNAVVENWETNGARGIITHATGAGKTIAALEIVERWLSSRGPAIVFVPSELLVQQWLDEIKKFIPEAAVLVAGAGFGQEDWGHKLSDFSRSLSGLGPRITVATMQTGSSEAFLKKIIAGSHLLVVVDEVHRVGSGTHRSIVTINAGGRLGLSATPDRFGDPIGTAAIYDYFGKALEPPFTLRDAIRAGRLVPYEYYVHSVALTEDEQDRWDSLSEQIKNAYARLPTDRDGHKQMSEHLKLLLIRRAAVLKQAHGKVDLARSVLTSHYNVDDRWLVYCDNQAQLNAVLLALRTAGLTADEYHTGMAGSREATMNYFRERGGILVAIRCLDEGVDIPAVNRALILASSANKREFIQRRGRVLRSAPGKFSATIHDALVVPHGLDDGDPEGRDPILRVELARAAEFAKDARNIAVRYDLEDLARRAGLREEDFALGEFEDEDGGPDAD